MGPHVSEVSAKIDPIWIACAKEAEIPVARGGDAYVHFDGATLHIADDSHLDADDTVAQLILHELCHLAVQGAAHRTTPDWGLDNTTDRDEAEEHAAVRVQAHVTGAFGLRGALFPTTQVRVLFEALGADVFVGDANDRSIALARRGAMNLVGAPLGEPLMRALSETARVLGIAVHDVSGHAMVVDADARLCGSCAWRTAKGTCRQAATPKRARAEARACERHEAELDCLACGACCRSAYGAVIVGAREAVVRKHPAFVVLDETTHLLKRSGDRCSALASGDAGPYRCVIYEDRPRTCRDFERAGRHCLTARRRVGLTL